MVYMLFYGFAFSVIWVSLWNKKSENLTVLGVNFQMTIISWAAPFERDTYSLLCHSSYYSLLPLTCIHIFWWAPVGIFFTSVQCWNSLLSGEPDSCTISLECRRYTWWLKPGFLLMSLNFAQPFDSPLRVFCQGQSWNCTVARLSTKSL